MRYRILGVMVMVAALMLLLAATPALAAYPPPEGPVVLTELDVAKMPPVAIGAHRLAGTHMVPPAKGVVSAQLHEQGLPLDAGPEEVKAALQGYYDRFVKQSDTWVNPKFQEWAREHEERLVSGQAQAQAIQPVTATVFAMAVDFGETETFTIPVEQADGSCLTETTTITGPLAGQIPHPPSTDNFTVWYSPTLYTSDASWYEKMIFGYEGVGRVRMDLTDPDDEQPGIDLEGITVQDYYDNVAGDGNVYITGTVEGWVTVPHSEGYYGADICRTGSSGGGAGVPVAQLVVDAIDVFSATNPGYYTDTSADAFWPQFDANDDGILDTFWVIHAGMGQEADGGEQGTFSIWSHSSDLRNYADWEGVGYKVYEGDSGTTDDDIYVGPYTMQPENAEVGVFSEEFGHNFFGLPDLYTTDAENSIGDWNIMAGGAWMGWLGGTRPASMPLWFKMIAAFDTGGTPTPVNWQEPMVTRSYTDTMGEVTIGQLEKTPDGVNKGVRVDLPTYTLSVDNMAGTGKGAYSGTGRDQTDARLTRQVNLTAVISGVLTMDAYWDIEEDWDYGYVMVNGVSIPDMDGVTTNYDPNGNNLGNGLTGSGSGVLRFDLAPYVGDTITLALRYKTDAAVTNPGWWVDNVALDGTPIDDFEAAAVPGDFPGWTNSDPGWLVVPTTATHQRYYLVEWRAMTKYDQMIHKSAYIHNYIGETTGDVVSRIPYNMPAALLYYRDTRYGSTYAMHPNAGDPPSYGSKYQLLIVDQNLEPMRIFSGTVGLPSAYEGYWTGRISGYDSGLTLQDTDAFTIPTYYGIEGLPPQVYPSKPQVTKFNDALGYYPGFYFGAPCDPGYVCFHERDGSAVVPARGLYSTRITDFSGAPLYPLYGAGFSPSWLGSGSPGDANTQFGVNIELKSMEHEDPYSSTATLSFYNYSVDIESTVDKTAVSGVRGDTYTLTYQTVVENTGTEAASDLLVTYAPLSDALTPVALDVTAGTVVSDTWSIPDLAVGEVATGTLTVVGTISAPETVGVAVTGHDGQIARGPWFLETEVTTYLMYMPVIMKNS
jgi:immune inhibitor A